LEAPEPPVLPLVWSADESANADADVPNSSSSELTLRMMSFALKLPPPFESGLHL
jgi:hypothetical protein